MTFVPSEDQIFVQTYSPTRDEFQIDGGSEFTLPHDMEAGLPFELIGEVEGSAGGQIATLTWNGAEVGHTYEWYVEVVGDEASAATEAWTFTGCEDGDADQVCDSHDNCPAAANPDQEDTDENGVGDACEIELEDGGPADGGAGDGGPPDGGEADYADDGSGDGGARDGDPSEPGPVGGDEPGGDGREEVDPPPVSTGCDCTTTTTKGGVVVALLLSLMVSWRRRTVERSR